MSFLTHRLHIKALGERPKCVGKSVIIWKNVSDLLPDSSKGKRRCLYFMSSEYPEKLATKYSTDIRKSVFKALKTEAERPIGRRISCPSG